jgi:ribosome-binding factor A
MSNKLDKYERLAKEVISKIIYGVMKEEEAEYGLITVTKCKVSKDESYLDVFLSAFKNEENLPKRLSDHGFFIQREANKAIKVRRVPKIRFRIDKTGSESVSITSLIDEVTKEIK